ncbi:sugar phosphate permease [Arcicella aurantiaca]|uniref:Sugar phosphate permease n=1 Tax=Arcicella aurantiaca TaxID=591202 RepID=A0A316ECB4_9BACT|nr:MFS transporter [Arcicella aurantiaca]PWK28522.1 sugar phosphate permease [Arcicella aurantiaca]
MKKRYQLLLVFVIFAIITYLDRNSISVIGTKITDELQLSDKQWGLVLGAFSLAYGAFEIPTGMLVDRYGPRITLFRIVIWWSIFTILTGFVQGFYMLLIVRFLFGAGEAGAFPTASVAIARWFPAIQRGSIQSVVWMGSRLGGALAPFLSVMLANAYGWRMVFYIFGSLGAIWAIYWWFWFKDEPRDMKGITAEEVKEIEEGRSVKTISHSLLPWKTFLKSANLWALMGMYHCLLYGAYFYMSWMPKYLEKGRGIDKSDLSWMVSLPFVLGMAGCLAGGFASDYLSKKRGLKFGRRYVGMFGLVMAGICMITGSLIADTSWAIIFLALGLAFKDFTLPVAWAVATDIGGKNAGTVAGTMGLAGQLGSAIMASAFGFILTSTGSYEIPVRIIGCLVIVGGLLWFKIDASKPLETETEYSV